MQKEICERLRRIAPNVVFQSSRDPDQTFRWDGDGPDPSEEGYLPYDVTVTARAIVRGELVEGNASLGGSYYKPDEPVGSIHGYLPQMLKEAAAELLRIAPASLRHQLKGAIEYLKHLMRREWQDEQSRRRLSRLKGSE